MGRAGRVPRHPIPACLDCRLHRCSSCSRGRSAVQQPCYLLLAAESLLTRPPPPPRCGVEYDLSPFHRRLEAGQDPDAAWAEAQPEIEEKARAGRGGPAWQGRPSAPKCSGGCSVPGLGFCALHLTARVPRPYVLCAGAARHLAAGHLLHRPGCLGPLVPPGGDQVRAGRGGLAALLPAGAEPRWQLSTLV